MKSPWVLRSFAFAGLGICSYLGALKLAGKTTSLAGCGAGSGCSNVLGSEWSQFFGIPVSILAWGVYLALLIASFRPSRPLYLAFAICLTGAALWFIGLLYFTIKSVCPWCLAMHTIGIVTSIILVLSLKAVPPSGPPLRFAPFAALASLLILPLGQLLGPKPDTHARSREVIRDEEGAPRDAGREVSFSRGGKRYNTMTLPHLGPSAAKHVMVKYFDYTCSSCRKMHEQLKFVEEKHPGLFCTILLPAPLHRTCNPYAAAQDQKHEHACELAQLSLAAWRADPGQWPRVHEQLISTPDLPPEVAEAAVGQIVGHDALTKALKSPWVKRTLRSSIQDFGQLRARNPLMPKVMCIGGQVLHGEPRSKEALLGTIRQLYKLGP